MSGRSPWCAVSSSHWPGAGGSNVTAGAVSATWCRRVGRRCRVRRCGVGGAVGHGCPLRLIDDSIMSVDCRQDTCCHHVGDLPRCPERHDEHVTRTDPSASPTPRRCASVRSPRRGISSSTPLTTLLGDRRADEVTTRDIATLAGVSERTVYRHFPDRRALLDGLSQRSASALRRSNRRSAPGASTISLPPAVA